MMSTLISLAVTYGKQLPTVSRPFYFAWIQSQIEPDAARRIAERLHMDALTPLHLLWDHWGDAVSRDDIATRDQIEAQLDAAGVAEAARATLPVISRFTAALATWKGAPSDARIH